MIVIYDLMSIYVISVRSCCIGKEQTRIKLMTLGPAMACSIIELLFLFAKTKLPAYFVIGKLIAIS